MTKIGILSPCGTGNLGDEATVAVLIDQTRRRYPQAEIYGLTSSPADTRQRHGITAYPARNEPDNASANNASPGAEIGRKSIKERAIAGLKKHPYIYAALKLVQKGRFALVESIREAGFIVASFKRVRGTDLLIVAGSGQLCDNFYGVWGFPYTLFKWSVIAKLSGAKLAYLSCGAGPIDCRLSRTFIKAALRLADYRSFRDDGSRKLIENIGVGGDNPVFPDLVFSSNLNGNGTHSTRSRIIAINPFPHCDSRYWPVSEPALYSSYVDRLASFASWLIKNNYTVLFFPTQVRADALVIEDVKRILMKDPTLDLNARLVVTPTTTFEELTAQLARADAVVASRFHGVLISFLLNKPVLALSHHPKVDDLMRDMGQSDFLFDIETFDPKNVADRLESLQARSEVVKQQIRSNVAACRQRLESQYRDAFALN